MKTVTRPDTGRRLHDGPMLIMGHRGAREIVAENTLAAFRFAVDQGVDAIELDVHLSQDGQLVVMHDATVDRTTNGQGLIAEHRLEQLRALAAGAELDPTMGAALVSVVETPRVPTFSEVLSLMGSINAQRVAVEKRRPVIVNVEIKTGPDEMHYPGIEAKVLETVEQFDAFDTVVVSSFQFSALERIRARAPQTKMYAIVAQGYFRRLGTTDPQTVVDDLSARGFEWVAIHKNFVWQNLVHRLHDAGILAHAWVVNTREEMQNFERMGIDAITTDRPDILLRTPTAA